MSTILVSFASGGYRPSQRRLCDSAKALGVDQYRNYSPFFLYRKGYYYQHKEVLKARRGAGYWLWKSYIILKTLESAAEGDVIMYADVDNVIISDLSPLIHIVEGSSPILLFANHGHLNRTWTKRDCFVLMNCDDAQYHDAEQVDAAQVIVRNCAVSRAFVAEWLRNCEDPRILTSAPNTCGLPNFVEFREHRWDQSVLSLLAHKHCIERHRSPTQYGNHLKMPEFRVADEFVKQPYDSKPWANSLYGTLLQGQSGLAHPGRSGIVALMWKLTSRLKTYWASGINGK